MKQFEAEKINDFLSLLAKNNIEAFVRPSKRQGATLMVQYEFPIEKITDLDGLALRLINFCELNRENL